MSKPDFSDCELLERFTTGDRTDAELAFEALVTRCGPMILGVWRKVVLAAVAGLPENGRNPVVYSTLRGKTNKEAARHSHCQAGTVKSGPWHARQLLRSRLVQRGPGSGHDRTPVEIRLR